MVFGWISKMDFSTTKHRILIGFRTRKKGNNRLASVVRSTIEPLRTWSTLFMLLYYAMQAYEIFYEIWYTFWRSKRTIDEQNQRIYILEFIRKEHESTAPLFDLISEQSLSRVWCDFFSLVSFIFVSGVSFSRWNQRQYAVFLKAMPNTSKYLFLRCPYGIFH